MVPVGDEQLLAREGTRDRRIVSEQPEAMPNPCPSMTSAAGSSLRTRPSASASPGQGPATVP